MKLNLLDDKVSIKLASGASQIIVNNEFIFIKHHNRLFKINARSVDKLLKILDLLKRPKKLAEIIDHLSDFRQEDVIDLLERLVRLNLLMFENTCYGDNDTNVPSDVASTKANFSRYHSNKSKIGKSSYSRILLIGHGILVKKLFAYLRSMDINCHKITSAVLTGKTLEKNGNTSDDTISVSSTSTFISTLSNYDLIVTAEDYPNLTLFDTVNKVCFEKMIPWLRVSFDDDIGYLGPLVIPGKTSCYNCCQLRLATNSPHYEYQLWKYKEYIPKTNLTTSEFFVDILTAMCANEIAMYLSREKVKTTDNLFILDTTQMDLSGHKVIWHPSCTYCISSMEKLKPLKRLSMKKCIREGTAELDLTSNSVLSDDKLLHRLSQIEDEKTGIVINTQKFFERNIFGINFHHFYGAACSYPIRNKLTNRIPILESGGRFMSPSPSGSGFSATEAKIRAFMEMVERYSNVLIDESRLIWTAYNNIENRAINPLEFGLYHDKLYQRKDFRCSRFSTDSTIPWIEGQDLFSGKPVFIAADFVYYPSIRQKPLVIETSNGAASHTNIVQAILNGLYEVIERDAFLIMWLNRLSMPILEVKNLPFGFKESLKLIGEFGLNVKLVDLTNDINIPTVMAVCYNVNDKYPSLIIGAGSHIDPEKAVQKALFEMEVLLISYIENPIEKRISDRNQVSQSYDHASYYLNAGRRKYWNFMISSKRKSMLTELRQPLENNYKLLMRIVGSLHDLGHRVIWINITPPDIDRLGIKVARVFVTGFQPLYFGNECRLSLERLYKVPTRLGYDYKETNVLNPALHPLS